MFRIRHIINSFCPLSSLSEVLLLSAVLFCFVGVLVQVYRSPEHFLSVIDSLSPELTDMPLPSYDPAGGDGDHPFDVSQVNNGNDEMTLLSKIAYPCVFSVSCSYGPYGDGLTQIRW